MARMSSRNTTVTFRDGDAGPTELVIGPGPGDFSHGATNAENTAKIRVMDRGQFDGHVEGEDLEQEWSITVQLRGEAQTDAVEARVQDWLNRTGSFSGLVSKSANPDIWAFEILVTMTLGGVTTTRTLPLCVADHTFTEALEGHSLTISGTNNGAIVVT